MITTAEINELILKTDSGEAQWTAAKSNWFRFGQWDLSIGSYGTLFLSRFDHEGPYGTSSTNDRSDHEGPYGRSSTNDRSGFRPRTRARNKAIRLLASSLNRQFEGKGKRT